MSTVRELCVCCLPRLRYIYPAARFRTAAAAAGVALERGEGEKEEGVGRKRAAEGDGMEQGERGE